MDELIMRRKLESGKRIVGIRFQDNDFFMTTATFLSALSAPASDDTFILTKENVAAAFNESAFGLYIIGQWGFKYSNSIEEQRTLCEYLKITEKNVFFDDEVIDYYVNEECKNAEFCYIVIGENTWCVF
jgi:hypothetical protein